MSRGDIIVVAAPGEYGKPRPALVVQTDLLNPTHASVVVCLLTSRLMELPFFRITVEPTSANGLRSRSQVMVDKIVALPRGRLSQSVGKIEAETLAMVDRSLVFVLGLAG